MPMDGVRFVAVRLGPRPGGYDSTVTSVVLPQTQTRMLERRTEVERLVAAAAVLVLFLQVQLPVAHLNPAVLVAAVLMPVWVQVLPRFEGARLLLGAFVVAVAAGILLSVAEQGVRQINVSSGLDFVVGTLTLMGGLGVILWARTLISAPVIAMLAGFGLLATVSRSAELFASNPWRFGYSIPVTIVVLAIAWRIGSRWFEISALLALALVSATNDARSNFGMLILAALLVVWRARRLSPGQRGSWISMSLLVAAVAFAVFQISQTLILSGYLGERTQERSQAQVDAAGSIILGGRPELAAAAALFWSDPGGFGVGAVPTPTEIVTAKAGMAKINYDPDNGYVERYMLGGHFELHSVLGDLWTSYGIAGIGAGALLVGVAVRATALSLRSGVASGLLVYLAVRTLWGFAFGPFLGGSSIIMLFVGLVLIERSAQRTPDDTDGSEPAVVR